MNTAILRWLALTLVVSGAIGCHGLLEVSDPTRVQDTDIANANGANARRLYASATFFGYYIGTVSDVAYFTDEWIYDVPSTAFPRATTFLDQRNSVQYENLGGDPHLGPLDLAFVQTTIAIPAVHAYTPDSLQGDFLAQLYAIRGFIVLQMAEDICPGFPLNDVANNLAVYGGPLTTDSALSYANTQFDSALKYVHDSTGFMTFARVAKGRALLDLGKYTEAAAVVASVPTAATYTTDPSYALSMSSFGCEGCSMAGVGNREGTNGLPFVSANDPRIPVQVLSPSNTVPNDTVYYTTLGSDPNDVIVLASGIEARLIQAEAALHNDDPSWKLMLDSLRATVGLNALTDPGTANGRVDLLYSERAFWLYMTGRRLGDLRRLISRYGRDPETVFPTGPYLGGNGGTYGTATSIPFNFSDEHRYNPHITTGCTTR